MKARSQWQRKAAIEHAKPKIERKPFIAKCVRALQPGQAMTIRNGFVALVKYDARSA